MGKKKKALQPRVKRMKRPARLASARKWVPTYSGKNLLRGYCNHFAVNWRCAAFELKMLGIKIDPDLLVMREKTEAALVKTRQNKKRERLLIENEHWHPYPDVFSAYLAGDYAAMNDFENQGHQE